MARAERHFEGSNTKKKGRLMPKNKWQVILLLLMAVVAIGFMIMMIVVDAFPTSMALSFIAVLFLMIILVWFLSCREKKGWRIFGTVLAVLFIAIYGLGVYYLGSTYTAFSRISVEGSEAAAEAKDVDVTEKPFNIYITGIDQWHKEKGMDLERSDVNMIVTVSPKTRKILLTSIPRDTYVPLHMNGAMDKLTHTGVYGVDETLNTVDDWLGIDMNYYVKANFTAVVKVINAMGGLTVDSPKAFKSSISKFKYKKGPNKLSGKAALYFARERKAFDGEDSNRVSNQQIVMKAIINKLFSSSTLLTKYGHLLEVAADDMETNMSSEEMQALVKMQLADLGAWDIETQKLEGEYDMDYVASLTQDSTFLVYKAHEDSYNSVKEKILEVMNPTSAELAEATATRQKNSIFSFLKSLKKDN